VGFRGDGSYKAKFRSGQQFAPTDNGEGINVYDGSQDNLIEGNWIASKYDGINTMSSNAHGNVFRNNKIGVSPKAEPAPLTGWGIKVRDATTNATIEGNVIRNAALGGIGLVATDNQGNPQPVAYHVRITRNLVTLTDGPAILLAKSQSGPSPAGGNNLVARPVIKKATTAQISGTGIAGATVEIFRADRPKGVGLPTRYLGSTTVLSNGTWKVSLAGVKVGWYVSATEIRPDNDTSQLARNLQVKAAATP
jgi:putative cofactor-binding repeat protein